MKKKSCESCRWCFMEDYGYSNYTTEGTQVYCLQSRHPSGHEGFDRFYGGGEDNALFFAEECSMFEPGESLQVDVEKERAYDSDFNRSDPWWHAYTDDSEVRSLLAFHEAGYEVRQQERLI